MEDGGAGAPAGRGAGVVARRGAGVDAEEGGWLPTTAYAILGLLSFGEEFTGYEVRRRALASLRYFFWSPAMSQVYTELRRLKGLGLVAERAARGAGRAGTARVARSATEARMAADADVRPVVEGGRRAKSVFAITPKGADELARWVAEGPSDWNVLKHLTCLRLFYGHLVPAERLIERLEAHRDWALQLRAELAVKPPRMPDDPRWEYAKLVVEWGLEYYGEEAASAERLAKKLRWLGASAGSRTSAANKVEAEKPAGSASPAKRRRS